MVFGSLRELALKEQRKRIRRLNYLLDSPFISLKQKSKINLKIEKIRTEKINIKPKQRQL